MYVTQAQATADGIGKIADAMVVAERRNSENNEPIYYVPSYVAT